MRLIGFTARCQRISYFEQYKLGVRIFDLRVLPVEDRIELRHGLIKYDCNVFDILDYIGGTSKEVSCRILLEQNHKKKNQEDIDKKFSKFCSLLETKYPEIKFFGGERKYDWKSIYTFKNGYPEGAVEKYSSVDKTSKIDDIFPFLYARKHNKKNVEELSKNPDVKYLWMDFIDIR